MRNYHHELTFRARSYFQAGLKLVALTLAAASSCPAEQLKLAPYKSSGIYESGDKVGWAIITRSDRADSPKSYAYTIKKNNLEPVGSGTVDLTSGKASVEIKVDEPAMLYLELLPQGANGANARPIVAGAAVSPSKLRPVVARPADFDTFWATKINALKEVPENAVLTPGDAGNPNVNYSIIQMDNMSGSHIYGQLAKPKREGKLPALVIFQWASPPYPLQKAWVTDRAAEGWLTLNIEPHDVLPDQPPSYYQALPETLKHYESIGNNDRDKSYFLRMYLADYRAVDYIASRPDWDGKTLVVMGISMGGQQSLCVAGLHPKVTHLIVNVPAGCDTNGPLHGRQSSYPNFPSNDPKVMETALYFDAVNFAPRIRAKSLVAMGFVDTISAPAGIWTAFNQIPGPKEVVPMVDSPHNHLATPEQQRPYTQRSAEWLGALVKGGQVQPRGSNAKADQPTPRTDANSQLAHRQLVQKAKQRGIDVYFIGDSITRRWGCTDPQYENFLANWKSNFFGWNAANFGWGADTTQNILWRMQNGELDNVNPKVVVILAGTNNLVANPGSEPDPAEIAQGIRAIVGTCREKAPAAKIILTGIFSRNDRPGLMPVINRTNENIEKLADGKNVYFVNINDKLADKDGKLFGGMMVDKLHPTVRGYQTWADALQPILTKELGPRAATDHAPPPTGDPSVQPSANSLRK